MASMRRIKYWKKQEIWAHWGHPPRSHVDRLFVRVDSIPPCSIELKLFPLNYYEVQAQKWLWFALHTSDKKRQVNLNPDQTWSSKLFCLNKFCRYPSDSKGTSNSSSWCRDIFKLKSDFTNNNFSLTTVFLFFDNCSYLTLKHIIN